MDYEEIIEAIRQAGGGLSRDTAERAAQATLQTLAERLPRGEARRILQELPAELKPFIYTETDAEALDIDVMDLRRHPDRPSADALLWDQPREIIDLALKYIVAIRR